jgi:hypothetical protein
MLKSNPATDKRILWPEMRFLRQAEGYGITGKKGKEAVTYNLTPEIN